MKQSVSEAEQDTPAGTTLVNVLVDMDAPRAEQQSFQNDNENPWLNSGRALKVINLRGTQNPRHFHITPKPK